MKSTGAKMARDQKGQLERLFLVQAGVAVARVVEAEVLVPETFAAAHAFRDGLAGEFQVHPAQLATLLLVDMERLRKLVEYRAELARLVTRRRAARVAVHGIALPDRPVPARFHGTDVQAQERGDLMLAVARDERYLARRPARVDEVQEGDEFVRSESRAHLYANGVFDTTDIFDMCAAEVSCTVADPEEVGRGVIVTFQGRRRWGRGCCGWRLWVWGRRGEEGGRRVSKEAG